MIYRLNKLFGRPNAPKGFQKPYRASTPPAGDLQTFLNTVTAEYTTAGGVNTAALATWLTNLYNTKGDLPYVTILRPSHMLNTTLTFSQQGHTFASADIWWDNTQTWAIDLNPPSVENISISHSYLAESNAAVIVVFGVDESVFYQPSYNGDVLSYNSMPFIFNYV